MNTLYTMMVLLDDNEHMEINAGNTTNDIPYTQFVNEELAQIFKWTAWFIIGIVVMIISIKMVRVACECYTNYESKKIKIK